MSKKDQLLIIFWRNAVVYTKRQYLLFLCIYVGGMMIFYDQNKDPLKIVLEEQVSIPTQTAQKSLVMLYMNNTVGNRKAMTRLMDMNTNEFSIEALPVTQTNLLKIYEMFPTNEDIVFLNITGDLLKTREYSFVLLQQQKSAFGGFESVDCFGPTTIFFKIQRLTRAKNPINHPRHSFFPLYLGDRVMEANYAYVMLQRRINHLIVQDAAKQRNITCPELSINVKRIPLPSRINSLIEHIVVIPVTMLIILCSIPMLNRILEDRTSGSRDLLQTMGVSDSVYYPATWLSTLVLSATLYTPILFYYGYSPWCTTSKAFTGINFFLPWFLFSLVLFTALLQCTAITMLCKSPSAGVSMAVMATLGPTAFGVLKLKLMDISVAEYINISPMEKLSFSLLPAIAYQFLQNHAVISMRATGAESFQMSFLTTPLLDKDPTTMWHIVLILISQISFLIIAILYLPHCYLHFKRNVQIFLKRYNSDNSKQSDIHKNKKDENNLPYELQEALSCKNVSLTLGSRSVLKNINLKMYHGRINVLLGESGSGKTTLMNVLTGITKPSIGEVFIGGKRVDEIKNENISYCQQQVVYSPQMTVREHLIFYAAIRGTPKRNQSQCCADAIRTVGLEEKEHCLAKHLSGGMQRRLCIAIAILGNPQVVFLDEPSSSLDVEKRTELRETLLKLKEKCCVVLSSHDMEETQAIADYVTIISQGRILCSGSQQDLAEKYGIDNQIVIEKSPSMKDAELREKMRKLFPKSQIKHCTQNEYIIAINQNDISEGDTVKKLQDVQEELDCGMIKFKNSSIEDIYVHVVHHETDQFLSAAKKNFEDGALKIKSSGAKATQLFRAMLCKRFAYFRNHHKMMFFLVFFYVFIGARIGVFVQNPIMKSLDNIWNELQLTKMSKEPTFVYDFNVFNSNKAAVLIEDSTRSLGKTLVHLFNSSIANAVYAKEVNGDIESYLKELFGRTAYNKIYKNYLAAFKIRSNNAVDIYYNHAAYHMSLIAQNAFFNAFLHHIANDSTIKIKSSVILIDEKKIPKVFRPTRTIDDVEQEYHEFRRFYQDMSFVVTTYFTVPLTMSLVTATFVIMPVTEISSGVKSLLILFGCRKWIYFVGSAIFDLQLFFLSSIVLFFAFLLEYVTLSIDVIAMYAIASTIYFVSSISLAYLISLKVNSIGLAVALMMVPSVVLTITPSIATMIESFYSNSNDNILNRPSYLIGILCPTYSFTEIMVKIIKHEQMNQYCRSGKHSSVYTNQPYNCLQANTLLFSVGNEGPFQEIIVMLLAGFVYISMLILAESETVKRLFERKPTTTPMVQKEVDVQTETDKVLNVMLQKTFSSEALVVHNLQKQFGSLTAVKGVSFTVHRSECFGLLGVNGAGKTTVFQMLTGSIPVTGGNAFISNDNLHNPQRWKRHIGYCPQNGGLLPHLKVGEMFNLFGRIRGIDETDIPRVKSTICNILDMHKYLNYYCWQLSGGNKRKLSIGLAIVGNPQVIFLDEPTAGIDVIARKNILQLINFLRRNTDTAFVFTSHNTKECEMVCDRVGIMVSGQFRCIGTPEYIKEKYGKTFTFKTTVFPRVADANTADETSFLNTITKAFPGARLQSRHQIFYVFRIPNDSSENCWLNILEKATSLKRENILVDFTLDETSLSDIFSEIVQKEEETEKPQNDLQNSEVHYC